MRSRRDKPTRPWFLYALAVVAIVVIVLAITEIGPPTSSARTTKEVVTAEQGVVQSTVTGSGNIAAGTDDTVNFGTSGTLQDVYVSVGQHVNSGQLIADLDPTSAQLSLDQAEQELTAAQDNLSCLQGVTSDCGSGGSGSSGSGSSGSGSSSSTSYSVPAGGTTEYTAFHPGTGTNPSSSKKGGKPKSGSGTVVATKTTPSVTVTVVVPSTSPKGSGSSSSGGSSSASHTTSTPTTTTTSTPSPGSIASAQADVYSAQASVHNAEVALNATKLYAPVSGTIVSLSSLTPGQTVSTGGSGDSSSSTGSSSSSSSSSGSSGAVSAGSLGGSSSSSSSSSGFAEIVNTNTLTTTVAFSESDINQIKVGQPATVSLDALAGVELAAHISQISLVGSTSSSVVSYDATLTLNQTDSQVKPGMSTSVTVITGQAQGVTVPNEAITGSGSLATVDLLKNGKVVPTQVVVGLRGDSRSQIVSGVNAGDQLQITITLPSVSSSTSTTGSSTGTLGGGAGGAFRGGGGGGFLGGGGAGAFFRGAGGG